MDVRRTLLAALGALLLLPATAAAATAGPRSCGSGFTWIEHAPRVRVFQVELHDRAAGFRIPYLYGCSARLRRPRLVSALSPGTTQEITERGRRGNRILIETYEFADGGGGSGLGWWDIRTGRRAFRELDNIRDVDFGQPILSVTLAPDGSIAYVRSTKSEGDEDDFVEQYAIYYLRYASGRFAKERRIRLLAPAEIDPHTLSFSGDHVSWRLPGAERTLAVPPDTSMRLATPAPPRRAYPGNCSREPGEGLFAGYLTDSLPVRLFKVRSGGQRGIWACRESSRDPARLVMPATRTLRIFATTPRVLAFATQPRGADGGIVGWFEPKAGPSFLVRTATLTHARVRRKIVALAPDAANGLVLLDEYEDGYAVSYKLNFLRAFASGFDPEAELATLGGGDIAPHTLAAAKGVITWRAVGAPRSARLPS